MRRYDKYKESGISWIGEIPEHWEVRKIKQAASCNDETLSESTPLEQVIRYVEISDVNAVEGVVNVTEYTFGKSPSRARRITRMNDVIVSTVRTYLRAVARVTEPNLIVSIGFAVLRARHINNLFLSFLLQSSGFIDEVISNSTGLNYPAITANKLTALSIPFPPLSEQEAIVAYLEEKVAKMDYLVAKQETQIGYLRELKQAIIAKAVTQGINPQAPLRPSGISWIGNIPEHWEVKRAKNMFVRKTREVREFDEIITCFRDGTVTLRTNRRTEGFTESFKEIGYQGIRKGDLVIHQMDAFAGAIGVSDSDGKGTPVYICLQPIGDCFNEYYSYLLREMARAGYIKSLYRGIRERSSDFRYETFARLSLPLPPLSEQEAIVTYIQRKTEEIDRLIAMTEQEIARIKELKQSLISDVVTGRIKVPTA